MKKIKEWLKELPEEHREKAIRNCEKDICYTGYTYEDSLADALCEAFIWRSTIEGYEYWKNVYNSL